MEALASGLVYAGAVTALAGAVNVAWPLGWLRVRRRRTGLFVLAAGIALTAVGYALPVREQRAAQPRTRLDELAPAWQFGERHAIRIHVPIGRVYRAVKEVSAGEIRLFRTLAWIRHPRWPWRQARESILAPPPRRPILEVALRTGFVLLAEEPDRELVLGAIVCCSPADAQRLLPRLRTGGGPAFSALREPRVATAAMNFALEDEGGGWTRLTTETRVHATDAAAGRLFATYWRVIYPGSALIRRGWLRAIKARAESG